MKSCYTEQIGTCAHTWNWDRENGLVLTKSVLFITGVDCISDIQFSCCLCTQCAFFFMIIHVVPVMWCSSFMKWFIFWSHYSILLIYRSGITLLHLQFSLEIKYVKLSSIPVIKKKPTSIDIFELCVFRLTLVNNSWNYH